MYKSILFHVSEQELMPTQSTYAHIKDIDTYADGDINEILYQDLCDYFIPDNAHDLLQKAHNKLAIGGHLHIQGTDLQQLGIAITFHLVGEDIIKNVLYPYKKSIRNMSEILSILKTIGFDIEIKKYINVFEYYIKARK